MWLLSLPGFLFILSFAAAGQENAPDPPSPAAIKPQPGQIATPGTPEDKRVFGVLPNYRTAEGTVPFEKLSPKQKFVIATKDSIDYPVFFTTAFFAGLGALQGDEQNVYGGGPKGLAHRYAVSYADQVIGNYFPEAIVPVMFHMDPRYFRKSEGSIRSRLFYSISRLFVCKDDNGNLTFNYPEFVGNSMAALTTRAYHPHERTIGDGLDQLGNYLETDLAGQILKEFWPDIKRRMHRRKASD